MTNTVNNPLACITGASDGFGKEYARQLAAEGYDLLIVARREQLLNEVKNDLEAQYGVRVEPMVCDLTKADELKTLENRLEKETALEVMVNNAGFGFAASFPQTDADQEELMIRLHCTALMRLSRAALVPMCSRKKGYVINLASVAAFLYGKGSAEYIATKSYVLSFSKSLQCDVRHYGVRVQALCPGFAHTGFHATESMQGFKKEELPKWLWLSAERVVRTSLRSIRRTRRVVCIPSLRYKLIVALLYNPIGSALIGFFADIADTKRRGL